jgi:hypothetical protein
MVTALKGIGAAELSSELVASCGGPPSYWAYLAHPGEMARVLEELKVELQALDGQTAVDIIAPSPKPARLVEELPESKADVLLVETQGYAEQDWATLDSRRSSLKRAQGVVVFLTTFAGFTALMRAAPNLESWLGGSVFVYEDPDAGVEELRARRLEALRSLFGKTDNQVVREAEEGRLPRDPQYAEWLSLLGRGDLLNA